VRSVWKVRIIRPELSDHEDLAGATALAALARRASAGSQIGRDPRSGRPQSRHQTERQTREQRDRERERQGPQIEGDLLQARQIRRPENLEPEEATLREPEAEQATHEREQHALDEQAPDDSAPFSAERRPNGEFLLSSVGPHEQEVRHIGARHEHHDADRSHQHPEHVGDVADDILLQGSEGGRNAEALVHLPIDTLRGWPRGHPERHHPGDVGIRLFDGHAGFQPRDALVAEARQHLFAAVELRRQDEIAFVACDPEAGWQDAHDFGRDAINDNTPADDVRRATEAPLPIATVQHRGIRFAHGLIGRVERAAQDRGDAERLQRAV
jgi:hypothetical protein